MSDIDELHKTLPFDIEYSVLDVWRSPVAERDMIRGKYDVKLGVATTKLAGVAWQALRVPLQEKAPKSQFVVCLLNIDQDC